MFWNKIKHFNKNEFACKCSCGLNCIDRELVEKLDFAREIAGVPFVINSACRCLKHNKEVGGVSDSSHLKGVAVDIAIKNSSHRFKVLVALLGAGFNRIGIYRNFIHVDIDEEKISSVVWYR